MAKKALTLAVTFLTQVSCVRTKKRGRLVRAGNAESRRTPVLRDVPHIGRYRLTPLVFVWTDDEKTFSGTYAGVSARLYRSRQFLELWGWCAVGTASCGPKLAVLSWGGVGEAAAQRKHRRQREIKRGRVVKMTAASPVLAPNAASHTPAPNF